MRHVFLPVPVTAGSQGMGDTAAAAGLVASASGSLGMASGLPRTAAGAVNLAAIAAAADEHLFVAPGTQEEPGRRLPGPFGATGRTWTKPAMGGILPPHSCPARCGAWRWDPTWPLRISARPSSNSGSVLPCLLTPCQLYGDAPRLQTSLPTRTQPSNGGSSPCLRMAAVPLARVW